MPADGLPGGQQRLGDIFQWAAGNQRPNPVDEGLSATLAGDQTERLEDASDLVAEIDPHPHQLCARRDQRADQLTVQALDRDLAISAGAHDLSQAQGVVPIGLVELQ